MQRIKMRISIDRGIGNTVLCLAAATVLTVATPWPVRSDDRAKMQKADPIRGKALSTQLCASCHLVGEDQTGRVVAGVPSFRVIANRSDQTARRIFNVLVRPHAPMPGIQLTQTEISDIVAYLDTLRQPDAGAPLIDKSRSRKKPVYPKRRCNDRRCNGWSRPA